MITSKIDRETYKRNKVKELMSIGTESDNEWFEENNLLSQSETKTENDNNSRENKGEEGKSHSLLDIDNFDFTDTLSSRLDAFQEKINVMLAEGNKVLNQRVTRQNVDLPSLSENHDKKHRRHHSHKVAFANDIVSSDSEYSNSSSSIDNSSILTTTTTATTTATTTTNKKSTHLSETKKENSTINKQDNKTDTLKKSLSNSNRKLDCKNMLQDAISFYKSVVSTDNNKLYDTKTTEKTTKPTVDSNFEEKNNRDDDSSSNRHDTNENHSIRSNKSNQSSIDSMLHQSLNDGDSILQINELELLRIEIKELKDKNKRLQKENTTLKINNSTLAERQKQQEQQIEKLKQKNQQLQSLISNLNSNNSNRSMTSPATYPSSPYLDNSSNQEILSQSSDIDWNNHSTSPPSNAANNNNKISSYNKAGGHSNDIGDEDNFDNISVASNKSIQNIKKSKLINRSNSYSNFNRPNNSQKNKSLLFSNNNNNNNNYKVE